MSNRVMNRHGARQLTPEEIAQVAAGMCVNTVSKSGSHVTLDDVVCIPDCCTV